MIKSDGENMINNAGLIVTGPESRVKAFGLEPAFLPRILLDFSGKVCYNNHRVIQS